MAVEPIIRWNTKLAGCPGVVSSPVPLMTGEKIHNDIKIELNFGIRDTSSRYLVSSFRSTLAP